MTSETKHLDRKTVPSEQRHAVKAELIALQDELYAKKKPHSQAVIGQMLGGFSQTAIGKAMNRADLGEEVRDALLRYRRMTVEELLEKHSGGGTRDSAPPPPAAPTFDVEQELSTEDAKKLEAEFLPKVEENYPGLGMAAIRGVRSRPRLRSFDLRTCWEAIADVRFEQRGKPITSLDIIKVAQAILLDEGSPYPWEPAPAGRKKSGRR